MASSRYERWPRLGSSSDFQTTKSGTLRPVRMSAETWVSRATRATMYWARLKMPSTSASAIRPFSSVMSSMAQRCASDIRVARARRRSSVSGRSIAAKPAGSDLARSSAALSCRESPPVLRARSAKTSAARP
jgi:hypothetical protein